MSLYMKCKKSAVSIQLYKDTGIIQNPERHQHSESAGEQEITSLYKRDQYKISIKKGVADYTIKIHH